MSRVQRRITLQPDIAEWVTSQRGQLKILGKERYKMEKGFVAYFKDFRWFIADMRKPKSKEVEKVDGSGKDAADAKPMSTINKNMQQMYESEELIKRMKWKRVTWEDGADYPSFSRRILENDSMFKWAQAFSFMSIFVVKDPVTTDLVSFPTINKKIAPGDLTSWVLQERDPKEVPKYAINRTSERRSAFQVDWTSGEVRILDTASAQELLTFLSTVAPRLQALQVRMEEQQKRITENMEKVRVRVGATKVRFNEFDTTFWDDPKRKSDPDYLDPDEVEKFLNGMLRSAHLYRWLLKGQELRIVRAGRPYFCDMEKKEVQIPSNFSDYNWVSAHSRFESIESVLEVFRRFWWIWFTLGVVFVADVELL